MGLYLSDVLGGPEQIDKGFHNELHAICKQKELYHDKLTNPHDASLNVVFQYPGSLLQPNFTGIKTGRYSRKDKLLIVYVAVAADVLSANDFAFQYASLLKQAIAEGKKFFDKRGIPFSMDDHFALVDKSLSGLSLKE